MYAVHASPSGSRYTRTPRCQTVAFSPDFPACPRYRSPVEPTTVQPTSQTGVVYGLSPTYSPLLFPSNRELVPLSPRSVMSKPCPGPVYVRRSSSVSRPAFSPSGRRPKILSPAQCSPSVSSRRPSCQGSNSEQGASSSLSLLDKSQRVTTSPGRALNTRAAGFWFLALAIVALSSGIGLIVTVLNRATLGKAAFTEEGFDNNAQLFLLLQTPTKLPENSGVVVRFTPRIRITTKRNNWRTPPFFTVKRRPRTSSFTEKQLTHHPRARSNDDDFVLPPPIPETTSTLMEDKTLPTFVESETASLPATTGASTTGASTNSTNSKFEHETSDSEYASISSLSNSSASMESGTNSSKLTVAPHETTSEASIPSEDTASSLAGSSLKAAGAPGPTRADVAGKDVLPITDDYDDNNFDMLQSVLRAP